MQLSQAYQDRKHGRRICSRLTWRYCKLKVHNSPWHNGCPLLGFNLVICQPNSVLDRAYRLTACPRTTSSLLTSSRGMAQNRDHFLVNKRLVHRSVPVFGCRVQHSSASFEVPRNCCDSPAETSFPAYSVHIPHVVRFLLHVYIWSNSETADISWVHMFWKLGRKTVLTCTTCLGIKASKHELGAAACNRQQHLMLSPVLSWAHCFQHLTYSKAGAADGLVFNLPRSHLSNLQVSAQNAKIDVNPYDAM